MTKLAWAFFGALNAFFAVSRHGGPLVLLSLLELSTDQPVGRSETVNNRVAGSIVAAGASVDTVALLEPADVTEEAVEAVEAFLPPPSARKMPPAAASTTTAARAPRPTTWTPLLRFDGGFDAPRGWDGDAGGGATDGDGVSRLEPGLG